LDWIGLIEASAQDRQTSRLRVALCIDDAGWIKSNQVWLRGNKTFHWLSVNVHV